MKLVKRLLPSRTARGTTHTYMDENGLEIVKTFAENGSSEVRAYVQSYEDRLLAHVRVFVRNKQGVGRPTPKGIALDVRDLPQLAEAVKALLIASKKGRK
jgi:hypothetical protein